MIYQLKITLKRMKPPVWRRIQVDSEISFYMLHQLIQRAFEWEDTHLHQFDLRANKDSKLSLFAYENIKIGPDMVDDLTPRDLIDEEKATLGEYLKEEKDKALYVYDFGDTWEHEITLEKIIAPEIGVTYPRCVKLKGMTPEEDFFDEDDDDFSPVDEELLLDVINLMFQQGSFDLKGTWKQLFEVANQYKKLKPWQYFYDNQFIVVQIPETDTLAYCSILGNAGEEYGMAIYLGNQGLISIHKILGQTKNPYTEQDIITQHSLHFSLCDRDELGEEDYQLIRDLGYRYRGKRQWPMFRSLVPGFYPWFLDHDEVQLFTIVLEQIIEVVKQYKEVPQQLPEFIDEQWLMREYEEIVGWKNTMITPQIVETYPGEMKVSISEFEIRKLQKQLPKVNTIIEMDADYFPEPMITSEGERPFHPYLALAAKNDGEMVFAEMLPHEELADRMQTGFIEILQTIGGIPKEVWIGNDITRYILQGLLKMLSIPMVEVDQLPILTVARKEMIEHVGEEL